MRMATLLVIFLLSVVLLSGQPSQRKIQILNSSTLEPLIGVMVTWDDTSQVNVSDINAFVHVPATFDFIKFKCIGFAELILEILPTRNVVKLIPNSLVAVTVPLYIEDKAIVNSFFNSKIINRQAIELNQTQTPLHLLNNQPGVIMQSGALNTNRISLRGVGNRSLFTTNKLKSYFDNIPLTNGVGETSIEDIDLSLLENVEIGKGPGNSAYGASLGGVIKMNSKNITNYRDKAIDLSTTIGAYGLKRYVVNASFINDLKNFSLQLNYNNTSDDGHRANNLYDRTGWALLSKYEFAQNQLSFLYNYVDINAQIPSSLHQDDYDNAPEKAAFIWQQINGFEAGDKHLIGLNYKQQFSNNWVWNNSFALNIGQSYELRPFNVLEEDSRGYSIRSVLSGNDVADYLSNLQAGIEIYNEEYNWDIFETLDDGAQGELIGDNEEFRRYLNLFVEGQKRFGNHERWNIITGININSTHYEYHDLFLNNGDLSGDYSFDWILSPRLRLNYETPNDDQLGFEVAHGFAAPTLEETLTPSGAINSEIQPEKGWSLELSAEGNKQKFNYNVSLYAMYINDLLVARRTEFDQFIGINAGQTRHLGFELSLEYQLIDQKDVNLNLNGNYSFAAYKFLDFVDGDQNYSGNELTGTAPHVWSGVIKFRIKKLNINFQHRFMDEVPLKDDNSFYSKSYNLLHSKAGYAFDFTNHLQLILSVGVNNILNEKYASQYLINAASFGGRAPRYYYPGRLRHGYGQVRIKYLW